MAVGFTAECAIYIDVFMESGLDRRALLALQLDAAPADEEVRLDLHDLYNAGYLAALKTSASWLLTNSQSVSARVVRLSL